MKKFLQKFNASIDIIKIIAKYEPSYLLFALPQIIINSILPLLYVYAPKLIIEKLTNGNVYSEVVRVILIYCGILLILNLTNQILSAKSGLAADKFTKKLRYEIGKITMSLELKDIESASARDIIGMANNATGFTETMGLIQRIVSSIITAADLFTLRFGSILSFYLCWRWCFA
jgi:ABC-type siderophore export system fused ATPase/permease subunit